MLRKEVIDYERVRIVRFYDTDDEYPDPDELEKLGQMRLPQLKIIDVKEID